MKNASFVVTNDLLASRGQRFLNPIIDLVIQYIIWITVGTTIIMIADIAKSSVLSEWIGSMNRNEKSFSFIVIVFFYYNFTEMYFSRSPAKFFTKTIVVMSNGLKPDNKTIFIRTLCRFIPFEAFSFLGSVSRGWHDTISQTYVVKKAKLEQKKGVVLFP